MRDLADAGGHPVEVIDRLLDLGWPGVRGETDEMPFELASLAAFASGKLRILAVARPEMP